MVKKNKVILIATIIIIVIICYFIIVSIKNQRYDNLATCLTSKGVSMAGTEWCPHCKYQKSLFGESFKHIDYHDCDAEADWCISKGIDSYPTWVINNRTYTGAKELEILSSLAGCSY